MRVTNTNYDTYNLAVANPRFILSFGLTDDYVSGDFSGRTATQKQYIKAIKMAMTEINPLEPDVRLLGNFIIDINDEGNELTTLIKNNAMFGRAATIKSGFKEITESDFINLYKGFVVDYPLSQDLLTYKFRIDGALPDLQKTVFTGLQETILSKQFSKANFSTTMTTAKGSGTGVTIPLANIQANLEIGDSVYIEDATTSTTNEITTIIDIDLTASPDATITVDLANTYVINSIVSTRVIRVADVTDFKAVATPNPPFQDGLYVLIDQEIVKYDSRDATNIEFNLNSVRTAFNSKRQQHAVNAKVKELWALRDSPMTLLLNILTTTSAGTNGSYDLGLSGFGAGMDQALIDFTSFEDIENEYFATDSLTYLIDKPVTAEEIITDIIKTCGVYLIVNFNGLLTAQKIKPFLPGSNVGTITDDDYDITNLRWIPSFDQLINEVEFRYDWVPGVEQFQTTRIFELASSKTAYGVTKRLVIESKGLGHGFGTTNFVEDYLPILAKRYGNPPPRVEMTLNWPKHIFEAGDIINLTSSYFPNIVSGLRDLNSELMEIVKAQPDPMKNKVQIAGYLYNQETKADVGISSSATPADNIATFNSQNLDTVQTEDATFDNSVELNVSGTRVIVTVKIFLGIPTPGGAIP